MIMKYLMTMGITAVVHGISADNAKRNATLLKSNSNSAPISAQHDTMSLTTTVVKAPDGTLFGTLGFHRYNEMKLECKVDFKEMKKHRTIKLIIKNGSNTITKLRVSIFEKANKILHESVFKEFNVNRQNDEEFSVVKWNYFNVDSEYHCYGTLSYTSAGFPYISDRFEPPDQSSVHIAYMPCGDSKCPQRGGQNNETASYVCFDFTSKSHHACANHRTNMNKWTNQQCNFNHHALDLKDNLIRCKGIQVNVSRSTYGDSVPLYQSINNCTEDADTASFAFPLRLDYTLNGVKDWQLETALGSKHIIDYERDMYIVPNTTCLPETKTKCYMHTRVLGEPVMDNNAEELEATVEASCIKGWLIPKERIAQDDTKTTLIGCAQANGAEQYRTEFFVRRSKPFEAQYDADDKLEKCLMEGKPAKILMKNNETCECSYTFEICNPIFRTSVIKKILPYMKPATTTNPATRPTRPKEPKKTTTDKDTRIGGNPEDDTDDDKTLVYAGAGGGLFLLLLILGVLFMVTRRGRKGSVEGVEEATAKDESSGTAGGIAAGGPDGPGGSGIAGAGGSGAGGAAAGAGGAAGAAGGGAAGAAGGGAAGAAGGGGVGAGGIEALGGIGGQGGAGLGTMSSDLASGTMASDMASGTMADGMASQTLTTDQASMTLDEAGLKTVGE